jgi:thioredoxin reductase (NADPH)
VKAELVIVGAGPAGVSGALWARSREIEPLVLDAAPVPGGQLLHIHFHPRELAGFSMGEGQEIAAAYADQLRSAQVAVRSGVSATALEFGAGDPPAPVVVTSAGDRIEAGGVLVASGVRRKRLGVPGERELEGRGVSYSANRDRAALGGREVMVAGGGDAAYENALILAAAGCRVTLLVRDEPSARQVFRRRVEAEPRIAVRTGTRVTALIGEKALRAVRVEGPGGLEELPAEGIVVKVGNLPNTEWCRAALALDGDGFVIVDARQRTSQPRVWAAGDVTRPAIAGIPVAMGAAALAIADIRETLRPE